MVTVLAEEAELERQMDEQTFRGCRIGGLRKTFAKLQSMSRRPKRRRRPALSRSLSNCEM